MILTLLFFKTRLICVYAYIYLYRIDCRNCQAQKVNFGHVGLLAMAPQSSDLRGKCDSSWNYDVIVTFFIIINLVFRL